MVLVWFASTVFGEAAAESQLPPDVVLALNCNERLSGVLLVSATG